jgi:putative transcriptional regulator
MDKKLFDEFLESVKEAGQIKRGEKKASRKFQFSAPDIRALRDRVGFSQTEFAHMIGVSVDTLQNWEQGRRAPRGPALALLKVVQKEPNTVIQAIHGTRGRKKRSRGTY